MFLILSFSSYFNVHTRLFIHEIRHPVTEGHRNHFQEQGKWHKKKQSKK